MKKETFINIINAIIAQAKKEESFTKAIEPFFEGHMFSNLSGNFQADIIEIIKLEFNIDDDIINWWLYDSPDAGRNKEFACILTEDGERVSLETSAQLYDYLTDGEV